MSSARRRVKRILPKVKTPVSVQPVASRQPNKGLIGSVTISLILALLLIWKFAPANSTPKPSGASAASVSSTSFLGEPAETSPLDPSSLLTPVGVSNPGTVNNPLPASVPAHTGEPGARFRRVVDKKIANGQVTLTLQDEQTGELSTMTQSLGTNVDVEESGGKERVLASTTTSMTPHDAAKDELPTQGIETIKAGMTVPTRNPVTGATEFKKVTRTFKHTAFEIVKLELADGKTDKIVDSLRGTPQHPFFTPDGTVAMGDLKPEMKVITRRGPPLVVKSVTREPHPEGIAVYNFEVEGDHTYFVGKAKGGVWVHNDCLVPIAKFRDYIFKEGATHGKDVVYRELGYGVEHSEDLVRLYSEQGAAKFARGEYTLGKLDQYGQRINIEIELPGIGNAVGKTSHLKSGWMIRPGGGISLNTPFSGFTR